MEAALRSLVQGALGEWISDLDRIDASRFPLTLRDLKLKPDRIQEEMSEDGAFPFDISDGKIGSLSVSPGWMGTVEVVATNIVLNFSFSPMKAVRAAMKPEEVEEEQEEAPTQQVRHQPAPASAAPVPPRYCSQHGRSEQRPKVAPRSQECQGCHMVLQTNYAEFALCPPCSEKEQRCMICGTDAPSAGNYIPAADLGPQPPAAVVEAQRAPPEHYPMQEGVGRMPSAPDGSPPARMSSAPSDRGLPPPPPPAGAGPLGRSCSRPKAGCLPDGHDLPPPPPPFDKLASPARAAAGAAPNPYGSRPPSGGKPGRSSFGGPVGRSQQQPQRLEGEDGGHGALPQPPSAGARRQSSAPQPQQAHDPWRARPPPGVAQQGPHATWAQPQPPPPGAAPAHGSFSGAAPAHGSFSGGGSQWRAQSTPSGRSAPAPAWQWAGDDVGQSREPSRGPPRGPGMPQDRTGIMGFLKLMDFDSCMANGNAGAQRLRHHADSALGRC